MADEQSKGMTLEGIVVKSSMIDSVTVEVSRYVKHPKSKKYQKKTKKYLVHNPGNTAMVGEKVVIRQTRPISKNKHFVLASTIPSASSLEPRPTERLQSFEQATT